MHTLVTFCSHQCFFDNISLWINEDQTLLLSVNETSKEIELAQLPPCNHTQLVKQNETLI